PNWIYAARSRSRPWPRTSAANRRTRARASALSVRSARPSSRAAERKGPAGARAPRGRWRPACGARRGRRASETRGEGLHGLGGGDDRDDLDLREVLPARDPALEQRRLRRFHELVAAREVRGDPAAHVAQPFGRHAPLLAEASVHRHGIPAPQLLHPPLNLPRHVSPSLPRLA